MKKYQYYIRGYLLEDRGQTSLIITFAIMVLLVSAAFFLTNTGFKNFQAADYIGKSSKSFYAAESGLEIFVYEKYKGTPPFVLDAFAVNAILTCGCVDTAGDLVTDVGIVASGTPAACGGCDAQNMFFNVEKPDALNDKVKSIGGYQNIERAVRTQW